MPNLPCIALNPIDGVVGDSMPAHLKPERLTSR